MQLEACIDLNNLLEKIKVDDVVSAVPVHLFVGTWATIAVALFADWEAMELIELTDQLYIAC